MQRRYVERLKGWGWEGNMKVGKYLVILTSLMWRNPSPSEPNTGLLNVVRIIVLVNLPLSGRLLLKAMVLSGREGGKLEGTLLGCSEGCCDWPPRWCRSSATTCKPRSMYLRKKLDLSLRQDQMSTAGCLSWGTSYISIVDSMNPNLQITCWSNGWQLSRNRKSKVL